MDKARTKQERLKEEIRTKLNRNSFLKYLRIGFPEEFLREDVAYFLKKEKRPSLKDLVIGLTLVRIYAKLRSRQIRKKSLKAISKKYSTRKYTWTIAYMYRALKEAGFEPSKSKELIVFFFNFVLPGVISNAGIFICLEKVRTSKVLRKKNLEDLKKEIPDDLLNYIDAFVEFMKEVKQEVKQIY